MGFSDGFQPSKGFMKIINKDHPSTTPLCRYVSFTKKDAETLETLEAVKTAVYKN